MILNQVDILEEAFVLSSNLRLLVHFAGMHALV